VLYFYRKIWYSFFSVVKVKTKAVRLHGAGDLRLDEFDLPEIRDDEILARVVSDSICMSSRKLALQGAGHKRVRHDLKVTQPIIGHEFGGTIEKAGSKWAGRFKAGDKFAIQPALNYPGVDGKPELWAPGYSFEYMGGDATFIIIPNEVMEMGCLLNYQADNFYTASLAEPVSCVVGAFNAQYHTTRGSYVHSMGITEKGSMALLAAAGPMGLCAIDYAVHNTRRRPSRIVVADIDESRLLRAARLLPPDDASENGVELVYVNTKETDDPEGLLKELNGGKSYDDVFVFTPVRSVLETGDRILGRDGCLNFFAGPAEKDFCACLNFYDVHYESHHIVGTSGGNTDDMKEAIEMMAGGIINPVFMITHIGGLDSAAKTTLELDKIPGWKKLIYTHKKQALAAIDDFAILGGNDPMFAELADICGRHMGLWNTEAEKYFLENAAEI
jgi:threonine dehydrogenase-like Zn-dependent dehydrogenase